jgi:hypothetical protein
MKVIDTYVFSSDEYKETILAKIILSYNFDKKEYSIPFSINGWPLFHKIIVYVGKEDIKIERPYCKTGGNYGSTTYPNTLIKVPEKLIGEVREFLYENFK